MDLQPNPQTSLTVANEELATVREAMRELNRMIDALERGEREKLVLTQRNRMRAVVVSIDRYAELEAAAERVSRATPARQQQQTDSKPGRLKAA